MANIRIKLRDGTVRIFAHEGRAGGSWTKELRYEGNFVVVVGEWQKEIAIPMDIIAEVETTPTRW